MSNVSQYKLLLMSLLGMPLSLCIGSDAWSQTPFQNYVRTRIPRIAINNNTKLDQLTEIKDSVQTTIQYIDGLGNMLQTVECQASPLGNDIVQPYEYDPYERETIKYLPYTINSSSPGAFQPNALSGNTSSITDTYLTSGQYLFYQQTGNNYVNTPAPYALTGFEPSPLNRIVEQGAPGLAWQFSGPGDANSSDNTVRTVYTANDQTSTFNNTQLTNNPGSKIVALYSTTINSDQSQTLGMLTSTTYTAGQLNVTIIRDENWQPQNGCLGTTEEYKDFDGHVILRRTYNLSSGAVQMLSTYYIYDDYGNLSFVLPPGANPDGGAIPSQAVLDNLCYQYRYDQRNRMIQKKLPGKGWEFMVYNTLDQIVMTQDANQRNMTPQQWVITKYDSEGRVVLTGSWQDQGTTATNMASPPLVRLQALQASVNAQTTLWETRSSTGIQGYTSATFPTSWLVSLTLNYYDTYDNIPGLPSTCIPAAGASNMTRGLLTCTCTNVLNQAGPGTYLYAAKYYDNLGRAIQTYTQHYLGGVSSPYNYDMVSNSYNFINALTGSIRNHYNMTNTSSPVIIIANTFSYDHFSRKKGTWEQLNNNVNQLMSYLNYNEVGQLYQKNLHGINGGGQGLPANITLGASDAMTSGQKTVMATNSIIMNPGFSVASGSTFSAQIAGFFQTINYTYNERGWLTGSTAPLFAMQLEYDSNPANITGVTAQYNGNIASQIYTSYAQPTKNYVYGYDNLNRLTSGIASDGFNERGITYDLMGNITALNRYQAGTVIDNLAYNYNGNQIQGINDLSPDNSHYGYRPGNYTAYNYDANGNMTVMPTPPDGTPVANINIQYNLLNLPQTITGGRTITYTYDAAGNKLRRVSPNTGSTDYISGIQYDQPAGAPAPAISFIQTEEGKAVPLSAGGYDYYYYLGDNLGNTRVTFDTRTGAAAVLQQNDYYPFGYEISRGTITSPKNEYLYNKKELQEELGQYDYGARFYDPVIARWTTVDPLAEKSRRFSPYNYVENNSIRNIDPDGMETQGGGCCLTPPLLGTKYAKAAGEVIINTIAFVSNFIAGENSHRSFSKDPAVRAEATKELKTDATVAVVAVMTDGVAGRVAGSLGTAGVSETEVSTVGGRASEIHSAVSASTQNRTTIAVGEGTDASGNAVRVVGSSENRLRPAQRAMLKPGEVEATGAGHAETTVLNHALNNGIDISNIGASRPICENCYLNIQQSGAKATTPLKKPVNQ